jgi:3-oxoacyl-[acyl-carrier-protein] synthase-3
VTNHHDSIAPCGYGAHYPDRVIDNPHFEKILDTSDEWITTRTGIRERRFIEEGQTLTDLCATAALSALKHAGVSSSEVDLIVLATSTADMRVPASAALVQNEINAKNAAAFDLGAGCSGFIYALSAAHGLMTVNGMKLALVIGGEVMSRFLDFTDRTTSILFGDGAGAVVLSKTRRPEGPRLVDSIIKSDGALWDLIQIPGGGSRYPDPAAAPPEGKPYVRMNGNAVFKQAVSRMAEVSSQLLARNGYQTDEIDWIIPHQANTRIMEAVAKKLKLDGDRLIRTVHRFGNTSAASIPVALDEAVKSGRIKPGDKVLLTAFGAGLTWGASLLIV